MEKNLKEIISKTKTVTAVARELGVSRQTVHKWLGRYKHGSKKNLSVPKQKRTAAHNKIPNEVEGIVVDIAQKNPDNSVLSLSEKLHDKYKLTLNPATIFRILKRNNKKTTISFI